MVLEAPHREKSLFISALKSLRGGLLQARAGKGRIEVLHRYPADGEPRALVLLTGPAPEAPAWQGRVAKAGLYAFLLEGTVPHNPSGDPFPSFPMEGRPAGSLTTTSLDYAAKALSPVVVPGTHILHDYRLEARGQEAWLVASDGFRLHAVRLSGEGFLEATLPAESRWVLEALYRIEEGGAVSVEDARDWVVLVGKRSRAAIRKAGDWPDWRRLMQGPRLASCSFTPGAHLLGELRTAGEVLLEADGRHLILKADGANLIRVKARPATVLSLRLKARHLHEALSRIAGSCLLEVLAPPPGGRTRMVALKGNSFLSLLAEEAEVSR